MKERKALSHGLIIFGVILLGLVLFCIYGRYGMENPSVGVVETRPVQFQGTMIVDGGEPREYTSPEQLKDLTAYKIFIKGECSQEIPKNVEVIQKIEDIRVEIYVNGEKQFTNAYENMEYWDSFVSQGMNVGDQIEIRMYSEERDVSHAMYHCMKNSYVGRLETILRENFQQKMLSVILCSIVLIFGVSVLIVSLILSFFGFPNVYEYAVCGVLSLSGSLVAFINYDYIQLFITRLNFVTALDFSVQLIVTSSLIVYLKCYLGERRSQRITTVICYIWGIMVIGVVLRAFYTGTTRPSAYALLLVIFVVLVLIEMACILWEYKKTQNENIRGVFVGSIVFAISIVIEITHYLVYDYFLYLVYEGGLIIFVLMQIFVLINISKSAMRQNMRVREVEKELMQSNITNMVRQIQPHFLYNSLGTIQALISIDPEKASEVVDHFSRYLRGNMESLGYQEPISFYKELEHVRNYLEIERVRFGEKLKVSYDLETQDFTCPALALQTTVENAVKHGLGNKKQGGTVLIATREDARNYYILVKDDGTGFDVEGKPKDGRTHVGIENTRKRIETMCEGTYEIESEIGVGTTVTITIPKKKSEYEPYEPFLTE